jgi:hypothetical protein
MLAIAFAAMVVGMAASQEASAMLRFNLTNGAGACQGALPNYEGRLRKRPTAIANEGTTNAFVSCSLPQDWFGNSAIVYGLIVNNNGATDVNVTCTLAAGVKLNGDLAPTLLPKTFPVVAGSYAETQWSAADNGDEPLPPSGNWSCNIPVGAEIGATYVVVDDGSAPAEPPAP